MKNSILSNLFFLVTIFYISGCVFKTQGIEDKNLRDRVIACGAGLSDEALLSLQAAHDSLLNSQGLLDFKIVAREVIFSEVLESDRLKAYEYYIQCIESPVFSNYPFINRKKSED